MKNVVGKLALGLVLLAVCFLSACGGGNSTENAANGPSASPSDSPGNTASTSDSPAAGGEQAASDLPPVKLKWVLRATPQKDQKLVQDAMNKILKEKINAEVELDFIDPGAPYDQKVKTMLAANEDYDIMFIGAPASYGDFYGGVANGAFLPITDLIKQYAPKTYAQVPEALWKGVTVNGEMYGVINYQIVARQNGVVVHQDMLDKYNFDLDSLTKLEDLEPLLEQIKNGEPKNRTAFALDKTGMWNNALTYYGFDPVGASSTVGFVKIDDPDLKVVNQFADPVFKQHIDLMRDWYLKGYINQDASTLPSILTIVQAGNALTEWTNWKPGGDVDGAVLHGTAIKTKVLDTSFISNESTVGTLQAISKNSKNPERAMMLLELMNTDKELYNLITFGIEGKHYTKVSDNHIKLIPDSGYYPNKAWAFGDQFNAYLQEGQEDDVWEQTIELNEKGTPSKLLGFVFDQEPVKTEVAQIQSVLDEYLPGLTTGFVDPDKYLPEFLNKLETAGASKVIAEKQKQLDAWKATQ